MATQINGKLFRNVKGANEGIVTNQLKVGDQVGQIEISNSGVNINGDTDETGSGKIYLAASSSNEAACLYLDHEFGSLISYDSNGDTIGKVEVNSNGVFITGDVDDVGGKAIELTSVNSNAHTAIRLEDITLFMSSFDSNGDGVGSITLNDSGVTIDADVDGTGNGYITLTNIPTSDPGVSGALWNDNGTLKISI